MTDSPQARAADAHSGVRVVVADDHPMWRDAVARDLVDAGYDVVATAPDGQRALRRTLDLRPDVLVLDLNLPELDGVAVCRGLRDAGCETHVLILSASAEHSDVLEAVREGATGYLVKSARREEFVAAVAATAAGRAVYTPGLAGLVLGEYRRMARREDSAPAGDAPPVPRLTPRETQILRLVATGLSARQIAEQLVLSHRTVQNHVQNTLGKLQLHNRVELVRYAIAQGLDTDAVGDTEPVAGPRTRSVGPPAMRPSDGG